jgi:hypothetical protein
VVLSAENKKAIDASHGFAMVFGFEQNSISDL